MTRGFLFSLSLCLCGFLYADEPLVTPMRIGRPDAPLVLSVWAQHEYSHLAARPDVARIFG